MQSALSEKRSQATEEIRLVACQGHIDAYSAWKNYFGNKRSEHLKLWINESAIRLKSTKRTNDIFCHITNYHKKLCYDPRTRFTQKLNAALKRKENTQTIKTGSHCEYLKH